MLRAAGEPTRLRILALLAGEELAVMEISQVLDQSQPRVSRHLKLLTEAGLIERFADGAWVFYRLSASEPARAVHHPDPGPGPVADDALFAPRRRAAGRRSARARSAAAWAYFARNAAHWDEIRSLYIAEHAVEEAILAGRRAGPCAPAGRPGLAAPAAC